MHDRRTRTRNAVYIERPGDIFASFCFDAFSACCVELLSIAIVASAVPKLIET